MASYKRSGYGRGFGMQSKAASQVLTESVLPAWRTEAQGSLSR